MLGENPKIGDLVRCEWLDIRPTDQKTLGMIIGLNDKHVCVLTCECEALDVLKSLFVEDDGDCWSVSMTDYIWALIENTPHVNVTRDCIHIGDMV